MRSSQKATVPPERQADAVLPKANPVSGTKYTVLDTTKNVRLKGIGVAVTWATTQPTPLEVHVTIDGQTLTFKQTDPVSATYYMPIMSPHKDATEQEMSVSGSAQYYKAFLMEGRSVKVEVEITWAVTQPTPLVCRVKYAKW